MEGKRKEGKEGEGVNNVLDEGPRLPASCTVDADLLVLIANVADTKLRSRDRAILDPCIVSD